MKRLYLAAPAVMAVAVGLGLASRPGGNVEGGGVRKAQRAPALNQLLGPPLSRARWPWTAASPT
jgi:hypothetical protein